MTCLLLFSTIPDALILTRTLWNRYDCSHFTGERLETQRVRFSDSSFVTQLAAGESGTRTQAQAFYCPKLPPSNSSVGARQRWILGKKVGGCMDVKDNRPLLFVKYWQRIWEESASTKVSLMPKQSKGQKGVKTCITLGFLKQEQCLPFLYFHLLEVPLSEPGSRHFRVQF